jgi:uncharacterized protein with NRDE domain
MCLIVFSYKTSSDYPFILAGNRDEFYERPTTPVHIWQTDPRIIAGKDEKAGGTWLGFTETGRFAAITNYRDMNNLKEDAPTRGKIVTDFLLSEKYVLTFLKNLKQQSHLYNGFNLIAGTFDQLYYLSNQKEEIEKIEPGVHVISNAFLNTPWPKSQWAKERFEEIIDNSGFDDGELFKLLQNTRRYPKDKLPETGLPDEMEKAVSSVFIITEEYGTRSSSIIAVDNNSKAGFIEQTYSPGSIEVENVERYSIQLQKQDLNYG